MRLDQHVAGGDHRHHQPQQPRPLTARKRDRGLYQHHQPAAHRQHPHHRPAAPFDAGCRPAQSQVGEHHHQVEDEQGTRGLLGAHAQHADEPGARPQGLHRDEARLPDDGRHAQTPEVPITEDLAVAGPDRCPGHGRRQTAFLVARHQRPQRNGTGQQQHGRDQEYTAPTDRRQRRLHGHRRGQRAEGAGHQHPGRQLLLTPDRIPEAIALECRHQRTAHAGTDQRASDPQHRDVLRQREQRAAERGDDQQQRIRAPRAEPVQADAQRQLKQRKREEIRRRKGAELRIGKREFAHQIGRDDRVDGAQCVRHEVRAREAGEDVPGGHRLSSPTGPDGTNRGTWPHVRDRAAVRSPSTARHGCRVRRTRPAW